MAATPILPLSALHEALTRRLEAVDSAPYQQGGVLDEFHHARHPLAIGAEPEPLAHLAFAVVPVGSTQDQGHRGAHGAPMLVASDMQVELAYRIRHDAQVEDFRLAYDALASLRRAAGSEGQIAGGAASLTRFSTIFEMDTIPDPEPYAVVRFVAVYRHLVEA